MKMTRKICEPISLDGWPHDKEQSINARGYISVEIGAAQQSVRHYSNQWPISNSLKQLALHGDNHCQYAQMQQCFESHGISMNALPPNIASMVHIWTWTKWKRIQWSELIITTISVGGKMTHNKAFLHMLQDGFIIKPSYMDTHLSYALCSA